MQSARAAMLAILLLAAPRWAEADEIDPQARAQAEVLFQQGSDLLEAGNTAEACPKLEAAVELTRGEALGGKLVLARCWERAGRAASAWGLYREVFARASKLGQTERAAEARARAADLEKKLHYLEVTLPSAAAADSSMKLTIDGREQPRPPLSSRLPIDPGTRTLRLSTSDGERTETVVIPEGPGSTRVELRAPEIDQREKPTERRSPPPTRTEGGFWSPMRIAGLSIGLIGLGTVGAGSVVGAVAKSHYDDGLVSGDCAGAPPICRDATAVRDARSLGDVGTAVFFSGLGVATLGVVLFVAPNEASGEVGATAARASFGVGPGRFDATVRF